MRWMYRGEKRIDCAEKRSLIRLTKKRLKEETTIQNKIIETDNKYIDRFLFYYRSVNSNAIGVTKMKINDLNRAGSIQSYRNQSKSGSGMVSHNKGNMKDQVSISDAAKQLQGAQETDPARAVKVADLKQAVSTGTYHVEA